MKNKKIYLLIIIGVVFTAVNSGVLFYTLSHTKSNDTDDQNFPLLSKRIFAENQNDLLINFVPLRKTVDATFDNLPAGTEKSFYFEYLPSGTSIRNGSDDVLVAASLIKVPLAMNLFKAAELGRINLDEQVTLKESDLDSAYGELWKKGVGYTITLRDASKLMLEDSDNTATRLIAEKIKGVLKEDEQSFKQLDIDQTLQNGQAVINAKSYSSVLRSLYLSSYLTKDNSQEILKYLAGSTENRRLTKYLPKDVVVAHKNGVYNSTKFSESDCGIVYIPQRPYMICAMIGLPDKDASEIIAKVSKQVYDFVTSQP